MKRIAVHLLAIIGAVWLAFSVARVVYAAADEQGFWWAYSCARQPVTFAEVDANGDGQVQYREASLSCDTMPFKRSIDGRVCIEYLEPKAGVPLQTVCRDDAASAP